MSLELIAMWNIFYNVEKETYCFGRFCLSFMDGTLDARSGRQLVWI